MRSMFCTSFTYASVEILQSRCLVPCRFLSAVSNALTGTLPSAWAAGFPQLQILQLYNNNLTGPFPGAWAQTGAFPSVGQASSGL